jgi:hypothetical protein
MSPLNNEFSLTEWATNAGSGVYQWTKNKGVEAYQWATDTQPHITLFNEQVDFDGPIASHHQRQAIQQIKEKIATYPALQEQGSLFIGMIKDNKFTQEHDNKTTIVDRAFVNNKGLKKIIDIFTGSRLSLNDELTSIQDNLKATFPRRLKMRFLETLYVPHDEEQPSAENKNLYNHKVEHLLSILKRNMPAQQKTFQSVKALVNTIPPFFNNEYHDVCTILSKNSSKPKPVIYELLNYYSNNYEHIPYQNKMSSLIYQAEILRQVNNINNNQHHILTTIKNVLSDRIKQEKEEEEDSNEEAVNLIAQTLKTITLTDSSERISDKLTSREVKEALLELNQNALIDAWDTEESLIARVTLLNAHYPGILTTEETEFLESIADDNLSPLITEALGQQIPSIFKQQLYSDGVKQEILTHINTHTTAADRGDIILKALYLKLYYPLANRDGILDRIITTCSAKITMQENDLVVINKALSIEQFTEDSTIKEQLSTPELHQALNRSVYEEENTSE